MNQRYDNFRATAMRAGTATSVIDSSARRVLRNTYWLLSLSIGFAAIAAAAAAMLGLPNPGILLTLVGFYGLLFLVTKYRNSSAGIGWLFTLTGFMGYTLGPILAHYLHMANGPQIVMTAFGGTAAIFLGLSGYAMVTKRDLSVLGGFLTVGILVAFLAGLAALLFNIPAMSLAVSAVFVLLMSGMILYETNNIVRGGETNYVMATVSLFVTLFNLFTSLLHLLGFASRD
jgi:modulator of FtsH protease